MTSYIEISVNSNVLITINKINIIIFLWTFMHKKHEKYPVAFLDAVGSVILSDILFFLMKRRKIFVPYQISLRITLKLGYFS